MRRHPAVRNGRDRVGIDDTKTRKSGRKTLSGSELPPTKPKPGLNGPPAGESAQPFKLNPSSLMYNSHDFDWKGWIIAMVDLDPHTIREVMSDARHRSKDPAEGFMLGISIVLAAGVIIRFIFGEERSIRSIWTYLEGIAVVYALCFLILLIFFARGPRQSAKLAARPAISLLSLPLLPLALALALFLYLVLLAGGLLLLIVIKVSGKKDFAWGTGSLADMFTLKWWKSKGWRPPSRMEPGTGHGMISSRSGVSPSPQK